MPGDSKPDGHVFLSYVREDTAEVALLQELLEEAGLRVWRDTKDLWPGDDWRSKIREAITSGTLAFVACFSESSVTRATSYQNEELILAIEQFRLRQPKASWLFPVRLNDCDLPDFDIGAGRTLNALQRSDLFGSNRDLHLVRLIQSLTRMLSPGEKPQPKKRPATTDVVSRFKQLIRDPTRDIELEDLVGGELDRAVEQLADETRFPTSAEELNQALPAARYVIDRVRDYERILMPLAELSVVAGAYGNQVVPATWARVLGLLASARKPKSGQSALLELIDYPALLIQYATAIAAVARDNLPMLAAVTDKATVRREGMRMPVSAVVNCRTPLGHVDWIATVLCLEDDGEAVTEDLVDAIRNRRRGNRYTPVSDHLSSVLRPLFKQLVPDDEDFEDLFDRTEVLLDLVATDVRLQSKDQRYWAVGAGFGRYTWRYRHSDEPIEKRVQNEFQRKGAAWPLLLAGVADGDPGRMTAAFDSYVEAANSVRSHRW